MTRFFTLLLTWALGASLTASATHAQACISAASSGVASEEEISFSSGDLRLGGILLLPEGEAPFPATVFIRGSGPSHRDNYWARTIADIFLARGIAVLLPDKRGSGTSEGDWRESSFEDRAADTEAALAFLLGRSDIDAGRLGLVGLSQGGKIAPIVGARRNGLVFVINFVGSASPLMEQVSWEMYHTMREAGLSGAALAQALELQVLAEKFVTREVSWARYDGARQRSLGSDWAPFAEGFPATQDDWRWDFFRRVGDFDPRPHWRAVEAPILVFYGEDDHNADTVASTYELLRIFTEDPGRDASVRVITDAGHALWDPATAHTHYPLLHREVVDGLNCWLAERLQ